MYPDDATLLARGKYSTLGKERRKQLERIQTTLSTVMHLCHQAMKGAQMDQPDVSPIMQMGNCVENLEQAAERVAEYSELMAELKPGAWA